MLDLLAVALALGVAGLDPTGALLAVAALGTGLRGRSVVAAALVSVLAVVALGTTLSTTAGRSLHGVGWGGLVPGWAGAAVGLLAGVVLLGWAVRRLRRRAAPDPDDVTRVVRRSGAVALAALVGLTVASAAVDPAFLALVVVSGRGGPAVEVLLAQVAYAAVSQAPLLLLAAAVLSGRHTRAVDAFQRVWARARPVLDGLVTAVLALVGAALVVDASWWWVTGRFLLVG